MGPDQKKAPKILFLNTSLDLFDKNSLILKILELSHTTQKSIIGCINLHGLYLFYKNESMRKFYNLSTHIFIDGMSLIFLGKLLGKKISKTNRLTYLDFVNDLFPLLKKYKKKIAHIGSSPTNQHSINSFFESSINTDSYYCHHGYFNKNKNSLENKSLIQNLINFEPDLILVGMGMPIQEQWIVDNINILPNALIMNCGACIEYLAGIENIPSRKAGQMGLEWLVRLKNNPKKLWFRYIIEPFLIIPLFIKFNLLKKF